MSQIKILHIPKQMENQASNPKNCVAFKTYEKHRYMIISCFAGSLQVFRYVLLHMSNPLYIKYSLYMEDCHFNTFCLERM